MSRGSERDTKPQNFKVLEAIEKFIYEFWAFQMPGFAQNLKPKSLGWSRDLWILQWTQFWFQIIKIQKYESSTQFEKAETDQSLDSSMISGLLK